MKPRPNSQVERAYAQTGDGQLHYRICRPATSGGHPPLFLLHPTPKSSWLYEAIMPRVAGSGRIAVAPDTPGYGASDMLKGGPSIEGYAKANLSLASLLNADPANHLTRLDVLGYHTGSATAVAMAMLAPERVRRLILVSLPAFDTQTRARKLAAIANWPAMTEDGRHLTRMWELVSTLTDDRATLGWRHRSVAENLRALETTAGYAAVYRYDLISALAALDKPVLLLNPEDDLFEITRASRPLIPGALYRELPATKHGLFDFLAEQLAAEIAAFLT